MYMVGAGAQPGAGTPSVMMSAKMTAREIAKDYQISSEIVNGVPNKTELEAADD
jgi:phytoene desaturase